MTRRHRPSGGEQGRLVRQAERWQARRADRLACEAGHARRNRPLKFVVAVLAVAVVAAGVFALVFTYR